MYTISGYTTLPAIKVDNGSTVSTWESGDHVKRVVQWAMYKGPADGSGKVTLYFEDGRELTTDAWRLVRVWS